MNQSDSGDRIHHNEMINLYTIKLKLLLEAVEKESHTRGSLINVSTNNMPSNLNFYKWNKKIISKELRFNSF